MAFSMSIIAEFVNLSTTGRRNTLASATLSGEREPEIDRNEEREKTEPGDQHHFRYPPSVLTIDYKTSNA